MTSTARARTDIPRTLLRLTEDLDRCTPDEVADVGYALQVVSTCLKREIERVKARARVLAGPSGGTLEGFEGVAVVTRPEPLVRAAKGADVEALRRALGEDFGEFFQVQTTLVPVVEALPRVLTLPPDVQAVVFNSIDQDVGVGGVGFNPVRRP